MGLAKEPILDNTDRNRFGAQMLKWLMCIYCSVDGHTSPNIQVSFSRKKAHTHTFLFLLNFEW